MTTIGPTIRVHGELRAAEDLTIAGRVHGPIWCEDGAVTLAASAEVIGDVIARDVTVFGRVTGQIVATEVVDVRAQAAVTGDVIAPRFILSPDAAFNGRAEPQHLEAALRVRRYRRQQQDASPTPG